MKLQTLSKSQLRRLAAGMTDPCEGRESLTVRKDHVEALIAMLERRERVMVDFVNSLDGQDIGTIRELCRQFWLSHDKWEDECSCSAGTAS